MANRSIGLDDDLYAYILEVGVREPEVLRRLRERTAELPQHNMQIGPDQGAFMALLARVSGARSYLEIGTFTGYSSTASCGPGAWPTHRSTMTTRVRFVPSTPRSAPISAWTW